MSISVFDRLTTFLSELERTGIGYTLAHNRDNAIMVIVAAPGERWEIEFLEDGTLEVERFVSDGRVCGEEALSGLLARYSETESDNREASQLAGVVAFGE